MDKFLVAVLGMLGVVLLWKGAWEEGLTFGSVVVNLAITALAYAIIKSYTSSGKSTKKEG